MKSFIVISFAILLISGYVKADCLPGKFAIQKSAESCQAEMSEEDKKFTFEDGSTEPESIRCLGKCILERAGYLENGTFTLEKVFKHIDDTFKDKSLGEYIKLKKQSHVEEASKLDDDCEKAKKFVYLTLETSVKESQFNVAYCDEDEYHLSLKNY